MMTSINNLYEEMNTYLADEIVLSMKIHNFHWFLKGYGFFPIHAERDHLYEASQFQAYKLHLTPAQLKNLVPIGLALKKDLKN